MPYSGPEDPKLPDDIRKASAKKRRAFVGAFNSAIAAHPDDEGRAMATAHAAMKGVHESVEDGQEREAMAMPDIATREDMMKAMQSLGKAPDKAALIAHIKKRAAAMGMTDMLPKGFGESDGRALLLSEAGDLSELEESDGSDLLKGVVLLAPGWSKNGRYYSREVVARSVGHWEGTRAFLDHPSKSDERDRPERSVRDLAGYYEGARVDREGRAVADLRLLGMHAAHVSALAREAKRAGRDLVGVSINAIGKTTEGEAEGRKGAVVEDITQGISVDIVTTPAAGGGFQFIRASADEETAALLAAASYQQWVEANPAHLERLREELKVERQTDAIKRRDAEIESLKGATMATDEELTGLREQVAERDARIATLEADASVRESVARGDRLLRESALPEVWHDAVRPALAGKSEEDQKLSIEAELGKLRALRDKGLLKADVKGAGQGPNGVEMAEAVTREAAAMLGATVSLLPESDEDAYAYKRRLAAAATNKGG